MSELLIATPGQTVGPFFHDALPYPRGNELVPPATSGAVRLHGVVYDGAGVPVPDALLEVRQADPTGAVPVLEGSVAREGRFTGWGRAATDASGRYWFTTLEPGRSATGHAPFFSVVIFARGLLNRLFTRVYVPGTGLEYDRLLARLEPDQRDTLLAVREPDGSLRFDVHLQGKDETVFVSFLGAGDR